MCTTRDYEALYRQLEREREETAPVLRFMLLDYVEHLLSTRQTVPPIPLAEAERAVAVRTLRQNLLRSLGLSPFPSRDSLHAQCAGRVQRQGYVVDKIIFHPRPGFTVPAHLYLPTDAPRPLPGILYASGHSVEHGIMDPDTQLFCIALARLGFAVFAYEAMGQGERGPYWEEFRQICLPLLEKSKRVRAFLDQIGDESVGRRWLAWAWHCLQAEHGQLAPLLVGLSQQGIMVWESIRALDYMCARDEIDATRLGVVGASGGGQNACYTAALDERVQAVGSICYLPSLAGQIRLSRGNNWWGGGDLCEQIPGCLTYTEFADVGSLILPRPLLFVVGQQDDGFPIEEARAEYGRCAAFYDVIAPGRLRLVEIDGPHGISKPMREATYGWFARWLQGRGDGTPIPERLARPEPPDSPEMRCLSSQASASSRPQLILLTEQLASQHARNRRRQENKADRAASWPRLLQRIQGVLGLQPATELHVEKVTRMTQPGLVGELLCLRMQPRIRVLATTIHAADCRDSQALILIVHDGDWKGVWEDGWIEMLVARGCRVAILDVRGTGPGPLRTQRPADRLQALEEILLHKDEKDEPFVTDFEITSAYLMMGRTLLGEQVCDLRRFLDLIVLQESTPTAVRCLGIGQGGLVAMLATALDPRIHMAATWCSPASFQSLVVETDNVEGPDRLTAPPASSFLPGVLRHFDLPDVAAAIAPHVVTIANPRDGRGRPVPADELARVYRDTHEVYSALGVPEGLQILVGPPAQTALDLCDRLCAKQ